MTGATPTTWASSPPSAIASVIDPKTSANRKPTTRPISSGGVRSWNSVWLGITKTMFAMPDPNASPSASARLPVSASRTHAEPAQRVADDDHPALGETRADQADDEPADEVADADAGLEEAVDASSPTDRVGAEDRRAKTGVRAVSDADA